jgi:hypothetical protein
VLLATVTHLAAAVTVQHRGACYACYCMHAIMFWLKKDGACAPPYQCMDTCLIREQLHYLHALLSGPQLACLAADTAEDPYPFCRRELASSAAVV